MNGVIVNRMGGLGNQLFQYAAARAVAFHYPNCLVYIEPERDNTHNHHGYDYASILMKDAIVCLSVDATLLEFHQQSAFAPWEPEKISPPVKLCGYFQYYPALRHILPTLINELCDALLPYQMKTLPIDSTKSVFMHIRRGDYLRIPHLHNIQTKDYYENAFWQWLQTYQDDDFHLFMISDDPQWCREQNWSFYYTLYDNPDEMETLAFMSQCKAGAIIANSSFSYWGAMLTGSKHVFYPEKWFEGKCYELFPSNWVCVNG